MVTKEKSGHHNSDEAYKMAVTDALSVAFKSLGFGAEIYYGKVNGCKYDIERIAPNEKPSGNYDACMNAIHRADTEDKIIAIIAGIDERTWAEGQREQLRMFAQKKKGEFEIAAKVIAEFDGEVLA